MKTINLMKKTSSLFVSSIIVLFISVNLFNGCKTENNKNDYLQKVLGNLDKIKSASYIFIVPRSPDTLDSRTFSIYSEEYLNPADTFLGSSFVTSYELDNNKIVRIYDGIAYSSILWKDKIIRIDTLPISPITPPFYNKTKSIIKYALENKDSISTELKDFGDSIRFTLYIPHKIVLFLGKPMTMKNPLFESKDYFSSYTIWISKASSLPFRMQQKVPGEEYWTICKNIDFNKKNIEDLHASEYFPSDFTVSIRGMHQTVKNDLVGKIAPDWILKDINNNLIALKALKSKVLMIKFTGIGCGPCRASIPFLRQLVTDYHPKDFEFISIETWSNNNNTIKEYSKNNNLNYKYLISTNDVKSNYQVDAVPIFYILDKNRIIRKIVRGYALETTDKEIKDAIDSILKKEAQQ
jgi:thiol-disulfide isomerase/thioredoxin